MMLALANARVLVVARFAAYAAVVAEVTTAPDISRTIALVGDTGAHVRAPALYDSASATLGWLATAIAAAVVRVAGLGGLGFVCALALALTLGLIEWRARRAGSPAIALCASLLGAACLVDAAHIGDGATDALCFAALLATFDLRGRPVIACVALVTALWCNLAAEGILAPAFAVVFAMGPILQRAEKSERSHTQLLALASALATLATPAFIAFPVDAWRAISFDNSLSDLLPGAPAVTAPHAYFAGLVFTMVVALALGARGARAGDTLVFALAAICAFAKGDYVPFIGIAGAPLLAETATRIFKQTATARGDARAFFAPCGLSAVLVAAVAGTAAGMRLPSLAASTAAAPYGILERYAHDPARAGRLLCTKPAWCDVAERTYGFDVIADSRVASAPDATIAAQQTIAGGKKGWHEKVRGLDVSAIFVDRRSGFATLLRADGWRAYGIDGTGALFVREPRAL
jgi:hypothetical protein